MSLLPAGSIGEASLLAPILSRIDGYRGFAFRIAAAVSIAVMGVILVITQAQSYNEAVSTARLQMFNFTSPIADNLGLLVDSIDRGLLNTRSEVLLRGDGQSSTSITALYRNLSNSLNHSLLPAHYAAIDSSGQLIATSRTENPEPLDFSDRDYFRFQAEAQSDALFVGKPITNRLAEAAGERSLPFSRGKWTVSGQFAGVVVATIPADYLATYLTGRAFHPDAYISLRAADGTPLVELVSDGITRLVPPGSVARSNLADDIEARADVSKSGLVVIASISAEKATATWAHGALWTSLAAALFAGVLMGGAYGLDRRGRLIDRIRAESQALMVNAFSGIQDPVILMDSDCQVLLYNAAADVIGSTSKARSKLFDQFPWIKTQGYDALFLKAKSTQTSVSEEIYLEEYERWFSLLIHPFKSGTVVYARDVTEAKKVAGQLHQAQKMETIGQLAGGVAHDFNNLLTVIIGTLDTLVEATQDRPDLLADLELSLRAAERAAELTAGLLAVGRRQTLKPAATDINVLLNELLPLMRRTLRENIDIAMVVSDNLWLAEIDPAKLEAAVLNLVVNARDAMPDGGHLNIETANVTLDEAYGAAGSGFTPGEYILVAVTDTGTGMPADVVERAFDPFFTTKPEGKGTGLGLAMVMGFVKQSGGHVRIYSELGFGTTVKLYLPRSANLDDVEPLPEIAEIEGGQENILLVEDDRMVRQHVAAVLTSLGYRFREASNAKEAFAMLENEQFDLILCDVTLPGGTSGTALVEQARLQQPSLKSIFMSGYTRNTVVQNGRLDTDVHFLSKPFRRGELAKLLREILA